jgi:hypothetical protein
MSYAAANSACRPRQHTVAQPGGLSLEREPKRSRGEVQPRVYCAFGNLEIVADQVPGQCGVHLVGADAQGHSVRSWAVGRTSNDIK